MSQSSDYATAKPVTAGSAPTDAVASNVLTMAMCHTAWPRPWGDLTAGRIYAEALTDAIKARTSTENRVKRGMTADAILGHVMITEARDHEARCRGRLLDWYTGHIPEHVRDWAAAIPGLATGELFPRILCTLGHPRIAEPWRWEGKNLIPAGDPYERTLRQLWAFCGCGDPERIPAKNMSREQLLACGKRTAIRPLLYTFSNYLAMVGMPVTKKDSKLFGRPRSYAAADSPFFKLFIEAKTDGASHIHDRQCQNHKRPPMKPDGCGTVAHPEWGEPGSPWRPGHVLAHAHRIVHKEFLRELWRVSAL